MLDGSGRQPGHDLRVTGPPAPRRHVGL